MLRVFTYIRRASFEPSTDADIDPFGAWFEAHPYATRCADFKDLGVSGLTAPPQRAGFAALLTAMAADKADFVLVYRWADLGRSHLMSSFARHLIDQRGADLLSVSEPVAAHPSAPAVA